MKTKLVVWLEETDKERLEHAAKFEERSMTALVRRALAPILAQYDAYYAPPQRSSKKEPSTHHAE